VRGSVCGRDADVAEIAGAVAGGDVHAATERDGEVRVVAADAGAFLQGLPRRAGGPSGLIVEGDVIVYVVADRLHPASAGGRRTELLPRDLGQPIRLA